MTKAVLSKPWASDSLRVLALSCFLRAAALLVVVGCAQITEPYDTSAELLDTSSRSSASRLGIETWDAVFYQQISRLGYEYEQFHAFFPLLPWLVGLLQRSVFAGASLSIGFAAAGALLSWLSFVLSACLFSRLSAKVLDSGEQAAAAVLLYCCTPASVFHAAAYTESLFGVLTFLGIYLVYCKNNRLAAAVAFAASSAVRSNGVVNAGFILHPAVQDALQHAKQRKWAPAMGCIIEGLVCFALVVSPFVMFQYFGYSQFCTNPAYAHEPRPWCTDRMPYLYGFVQKEYWGVGFMKYFRPQQVPNFILAFPILSLSLSAVAAFAVANPHTCLTLGLLERTLQHNTLQGPIPSNHQQKRKERNEPPAPEECGAPAPRPLSCAAPRSWLPPHTAVFIFHWAFLALVALLVMHVQVATRFLSCSPALYWYMAHLWQRRQQRWLWYFCFGYMAVGSLMFANFLPWT